MNVVLELKKIKLDIYLLWSNIQNLNSWFDSAYFKKNPNNSIFDEIKESSILEPLELNVDQFDKGAQTSQI